MTIAETPGSDTQYKLVFAGELKPGFDQYSVKARLASRYQVSEAEIAPLFSGAPALILDGVEYHRALEVSREFEKAGAVCRLLKMGEKPDVAGSFSGQGLPEAEKARETAATEETESQAGSGPAFPAPRFSAPMKKTTPKTSRRGIAVLLGFLILAFIGFRILSTGNHLSDTASAGQPPAEPRDASPPPMISVSDPRGYYTFLAPEGFRLSDKSTGKRSYRTFAYPGGVTLTIIASAMAREWRPEEEMTRRLEAIRGGQAGPLSAFEIEDYGLVEFHGLDGYELELVKGQQRAHAYALVSLENTAFSIAIMDPGSRGTVDMAVLNAAVRTGLIPLK